MLSLPLSAVHMSVTISQNTDLLKKSRSTNKYYWNSTARPLSRLDTYLLKRISLIPEWIYKGSKSFQPQTVYTFTWPDDNLSRKIMVKIFLKFSLSKSINAVQFVIQWPPLLQCARCILIFVYKLKPVKLRTNFLQFTLAV